MPSLLNQLTGEGRLMKGRIVPDQDRLRGELLEQMLLQPNIEPLRIRIPLKQHRSPQALARFPRNQARARAGLPVPFTRDSVSAASPAIGSMGRRFKPTFIKRDDVGRSLSCQNLSELLDIRPALGWVSFSVPQSFFYA